MIEIRTEENGAVAHPNGPHHHEQTRAIAEALSETARLLNYATLPGNGGLRYPSDVYSVLGSLAGMTRILPQALEQVADWIAAEVSAGRAQENPHYGPYRGDAAAAATALRSVLAEAARTANQLGGLLDEGQTAVRGLESARQDDE